MLCHVYYILFPLADLKVLDEKTSVHSNAAILTVGTGNDSIAIKKKSIPLLKQVY